MKFLKRVFAYFLEILAVALTFAALIALVWLFLVRVAKAAEYDVLPASTDLIPAHSLALQRSSTIPSPIPSFAILGGEVRGRHWSYLVPFAVQNVSVIEKLIGCESQGVNVSRPDSNGRISDGILQFNRGPADTLGSGTWADMEHRFNFLGSPINPPDAIHLADLMISAGFIHRWSCARILSL